MRVEGREEEQEGNEGRKPKTTALYIIGNTGGAAWLSLIIINYNYV